MVNAVLRVPHGFLRRHLSMTERVLVAAGLALMEYGLMTSLPAYPSPWEAVVATAIFFIMLWSPTLGYFLAVTAAMYPLYTLSMYLAVLFLAIALLGQRVFINNIGATLLVLLAPWLAQYHLEWAVVLLGGLWWGKIGGAWMGGLAALWGQLLFGMAGRLPNWLDMMGAVPSLPGLAAQFKDANSLETLKLIVTPLATNPTELLYHLLQIALWGMVAALLGGLAETAWAQQKHPWRTIAMATIAAAALALVNLGLANWLQEYKASDFTWIMPGLMESALYAAIAAAGLETMRDFIEHPLGQRLPAEKRYAERQAAQRPDAMQPSTQVSLTQRLATRFLRLRRAAQQPETTAENTIETSSYPPIPVPSNLPHRETKKQQPDDIIKIELD
jgi:hypothetical protein